MDGIEYKSQVISIINHQTQGLENDQPEMEIQCSITTPVIASHIQRSEYPNLEVDLYDESALNKAVEHLREKSIISTLKDGLPHYKYYQSFRYIWAGHFLLCLIKSRIIGIWEMKITGLPLNEYTVRSRVVANNRQNITVSSIGLLAQTRTTPPDQYFRGGAVRNLRNQEVVMITYQTGKELTLLKPFYDLEVNDRIELIAGYDRSFEQAII